MDKNQIFAEQMNECCGGACGCGHKMTEEESAESDTKEDSGAVDVEDK